MWLLKGKPQYIKGQWIFSIFKSFDSAMTWLNKWRQCAGITQMNDAFKRLKCAAALFKGPVEHEWRGFTACMRMENAGLAEHGGSAVQQ